MTDTPVPFPLRDPAAVAGWSRRADGRQRPCSRATGQDRDPAPASEWRGRFCLRGVVRAMVAVRTETNFLRCGHGQ